MSPRPNPKKVFLKLDKIGGVGGWVVTERAPWKTTRQWKMLSKNLVQKVNRFIFEQKKPKKKNLYQDLQENDKWRQEDGPKAFGGNPAPQEGYGASDLSRTSSENFQNMVQKVNTVLAKKWHRLCLVLSNLHVDAAFFSKRAPLFGPKRCSLFGPRFELFWRGYHHFERVVAKKWGPICSDRHRIGTPAKPNRGFFFGFFFRCKKRYFFLGSTLKTFSETSETTMTPPRDKNKQERDNKRWSAKPK